MDIEVLQVHGETADGQYEVATAPYDAVTAADKLILTKHAIIGLAQQSGLVATFLPKLAIADAGSGCHCHFSLTKVLKRAQHVSDLGEWFVHDATKYSIFAGWGECNGRHGP